MLKILHENKHVIEERGHKCGKVGNYKCKWCVVRETYRQFLYMDLCHVKILKSNLNHMDIIFACFVTTFIFV